MRRFIFMCLLTLTLLTSHMQALAISLTSPASNFVPVRQVGESLGYKVIWNKYNKVVTISTNTLSATLSPNTTTCTLTNNSVVTLSEPPKLIEGTLFVPAQFWSQAFNLDVKVDNGNLTIKKPSVSESSKSLDDIIAPIHPGNNNVYTNQKLGIRLTENPSTGYTWEVNLPTGIELISDTFTHENDSLVGSPGTRHWLIRATKPGTYKLIFNYIRPFDPATSADTQTFIIEAKDFVPPTT